MVVTSRAQKNWEDGKESFQTKPNLIDSLVPKHGIKQTDQYRQTVSQKLVRKTHRQTLRLTD